MPLESRFGPSEAVLEGLGPPKIFKTNCFGGVCKLKGLRYFRALDGPLGPILAPLEPIWSQNGSQTEITKKTTSKPVPQMILKSYLSFIDFWTHFGPIFGARKEGEGRGWQGLFRSRVGLFQDAPKESPR